jgi:hypothetical protein
MNQTQDPEAAWSVGLFACFVTGVVEVVGAFAMEGKASGGNALARPLSPGIRSYIPRASMSASIGGLLIVLLLLA